MTGLRSNLDLISEIWETEAGGSKVAKIQDLPQLSIVSSREPELGGMGRGVWEGYLCALWAIVKVTVFEHK